MDSFSEEIVQEASLQVSCLWDKKIYFKFEKERFGKFLF